MKEKNIVYQKLLEKNEEIKIQNAKLMLSAQLMHLEHKFQNRLCSSGRKSASH